MDFENAKEKISEFHRQHLEKPIAPPKLINSDKYDLETVYESFQNEKS